MAISFGIGMNVPRQYMKQVTYNDDGGDILTGGLADNSLTCQIR